MDQILEWAPSLVFSLFCFILTFMIRRPIEGFWPAIRRKAWWEKGLLQIIPPAFGGVLAVLMQQYPFPSYFNDGWAVRVPYGVLLGFVSSLVYKFAKAKIKEKTGLDLGGTMPNSMNISPDVEARIKKIEQARSEAKPTEEKPEDQPKP